METTFPSHGDTTIPFICLPSPQIVFQARAARFRQLAETHASLGGYLRLMADLAQIQHDLALAPRESNSRDMARAIAEHMNGAGEPLATLLGRIRQASDAQLDAWADALVAADFEHIDAGLAPFIAAALQVQRTAQAARLDPAQLALPEAGYLCPVCGSSPVAGALRTGGGARGLRYLCCSFCATEWHRVRIHCVNCGSSEKVGYYGIEGAGRAVQAEACGECGVYLKLMNREKEPRLDTVADDIATLSLDILMAEEGYARLGFNPLLIPGAGDGRPQPH